MDKNFKIEVTKGSGPGGQHRNKVESCVTITHIPSGMKEKCEESRSQHKNKELAMERLLERIETNLKIKKLKKLNDTRNKTVNEAGRIRTYNEQRNEVTDHRTGKTASYDEVLNKGKLDLLK